MSFHCGELYSLFKMIETMGERVIFVSQFGIGETIENEPLGNDVSIFLLGLSIDH